MRFGKRRRQTEPPDAPGSDAAAEASSPARPIDSSTVPVAGPGVEGEARAAAGAEPYEEAAAAPPTGDELAGEPTDAGYAEPGGEHAGAADEPVVEGEAVELPRDERAEAASGFAPLTPPPPVAPEPMMPAPAPAPAAEQPPGAPRSMPFPVADQPVAVVTPESGPAPPPVTSLGETAEAYASGHAAAPGPSWQEPVMELANERPELVVAAAFAGGALAAMILKRLAS